MQERLMEVTVTAKIRLEVPAEHKRTILLTMNQYKDACNHVSAYVFRTHELSFLKLNDKLYHELRDTFDLPSQMAQDVMKTVIAKYKSVQENGHPWTEVRFKRPQMDSVFGREYSFKENTLSLRTLFGRIKGIPMITKGMETFFNDVWSFGTLKVLYKHGKFYIHVPVTKEFPECVVDEDVRIVGVDRGINFIYTAYGDYGETLFFSGKDAKRKRANYKALREELQGRHTSSARHRLKEIGNRENRWMADMNHVASKTLVEFYPEDTIFILEDLTGIRPTLERVHHKYRYIQVSWSFYDFQKKLEYKALMHGQKVIYVDPHYTSQKCPRCGHTAKSNRNKKKHSFECRNCGYRSNDDRIGAINLYDKGVGMCRV